MDYPRSPELEGATFLRASLEAAGRKFTRQRAGVYDQLRALREHPTAEDVYRRVKAVLPSISLATVYKALETLVDSGLATKLVAIDGPARYDARIDHHYHLRCLRSGSVEDLPTEYDPDLIARIDPRARAEVTGPGVPGHRLPAGTGRLLRRSEGRSRKVGSSMNPTFPLVDTHAHLDDRRLKGRLADVLRTAREAGVVHVVAVATTAVGQRVGGRDGSGPTRASSPRSASTPMTRPTPRRATGTGRSENSPSLPEVVALGETGTGPPLGSVPSSISSASSFGRHLDLAASSSTAPSSSTVVNAIADIVGQLGRLGRPVRGVLHSFSGTWPEAEELLELGLYISLSPGC